ncbi:MAG: chromosomal replication initiator protein DnaA [Candidatus Woykebacteria bacterium RBG_13_40_15]|uniref:Chromosomal replication initiator protein DnaA n=1 Tax=Candidatus Woykebacteria bacterium RBG_13_40_15 TaxID=1802593 RepID=A0A1G1W9S0_9BACT|nr:MAG: chromosomal replication initiator protein DnaA [Candidatus Woykebacteria bacterium RBG_13_40_15]
MDEKSLWESVLTELQLTLSAANFQTWFKGKTGVLSLKDGVVEIGCSSPYNKTWIEERYLGQIKEIVERISGASATLVFTVSAKGLEAPKVKEPKNPELAIPLFEDAASSTIKESLVVSNINPKYSFADFIVGQSNQLAYAVAKAVVDSPFERYNPLLIYGGVGVGKTHLLQAIGQGVILRRNPSRVIYSSSETFTNDMIEAIQKRQTVDFRAKYRAVDLLLIDDIQFIAGRESTQEEFFHTFNHLHGRGKQIILCCDRDPAQLSNLHERLRNRFSGGMVVKIETPDLELREAILLAKAHSEGASIDFPTIRFMAERLGPSVRSLEGGLLRLLAIAKLTGRAINEELVKNSINLDPPKKPSAEEILAEIARFFSLSLSDLRGVKRGKECVFPRQVAMYLLRTEVGLSFNEIASLLGGRDHTTVIYSVSKVENLVEKDGEIGRIVAEVKDKALGG